MPYAKKRYSKKSSYGTRKRRSTRNRRSAPMRSIRPKYTGQTYNFKRSLYGEVITTAGQYKAGVTWNLTQIPGYSEWTALFDQYRLTGVAIQFTYRATNTSVLESINNGHVGLPILWHVVDTDDNSAPASIAELGQVGKCKRFIFDSGKRTKTIFIRPRYLNRINGTGSTVANTVGDRKAWIDLLDNDVPHYGLKYILDLPQALVAYNVTFDVITTYYVQFKNAR